MLEIYIDNEIIDLPPSFELESEENNPLFSLDALTDGSFCYTVSIPNSPRNARIANYPYRIESSKEHIFRKICEIKDKGKHADSGVAIFSQSSANTIDLSIGTGESAFVNLSKKIKIKQGDYGTMTFSLFDRVDYVSYPASKFALPVVFNQSALIGYTNIGLVNDYYDNFAYQNGFREDGVLGHYNTPMMFFFYILNFWATKLGYTLEYKMPANDERMNAVIYSPNIKRVNTALEPNYNIQAFNPADFLPDVTLLDMIVTFKQTTFLQFFVDEESQSIIVDDIANIKKWPIVDITSMVQFDYEETHNDIVSNVKITRQYEEPDEEQKNIIDINSENYLGALQSVINLPLAADSARGAVIYIINDGQYYRNVTIASGATFVQQWQIAGVNEAEHVNEMIDLAGDDFPINLPATIWNIRNIETAYGGGASAHGFMYIPIVNQKGEMIGYHEDGRPKTTFGLRFLLSRGVFHNNMSSYTDPGAGFRFGSNSVFNIYQKLDGSEAPNFKESLLFTDFVIEDGVMVDKGIYETKIKKILEYTVNKRVFTFYLTVPNNQALKKIKFNSLVSIRGTNFLVKKKKYIRTHAGIKKDVALELVPFTA